MEIENVVKACERRISDKCILSGLKQEFRGSYCVECHRTYMHLHYQTNKMKILEQARARYISNGRPRGRPRKVINEAEQVVPSPLMDDVAVGAVAQELP